MIDDGFGMALLILFLLAWLGIAEWLSSRKESRKFEKIRQNNYNMNWGDFQDEG